MKGIKLDDIDRELLELLEQDSAQPIKKISKITGIRPSTVFHRIKRLKEEGVILGHTIRIDRTKFGTPLGIYVFVRFDNTKLTYGRKGGMSKRIMEIPFVESASEVTGNIDIIVKAYAPSIEEMNDLVVNKIRELEGVTSTETFVIIKDRTRK